MNRILQFLLCTLLSSGLLIVTAMPSAAAPPNASLVGTWTAVVPQNEEVYGGAQKVFLTIRKNRSYILYSPAYGSEGRFDVTQPNGWHLVSQTSIYSDGGTYRLAGPDKLQLTNRLGTHTWTRVPYPPFISQRVVDGERVPSGVPGAVYTAVAGAQAHWHSDAEPVMIDVIPDGYGRKKLFFQVTVSLYSPSTNTGLQINIKPYSAVSRPIATSNLSKRPIAAKLVDLPEVIATARRNGMRDAFKSAWMMDWPHYGAVWEIKSGSPNGDVVHGFNILASGAILKGPGPGSEEIARENAEWARAIANLRSFIAQMKSHSPSGGTNLGYGQAWDAYYRNHGHAPGAGELGSD